MEYPLLRLRFAEDPAHELNQLGDFAILDEAQTVPEVFPALRGAIDAHRADRRCHFCVLGSAQPALIRGLSESLAGRVGLLELDPLTPTETGLPTATHWLAGGFPDALRGDFRTWWEPYLEHVWAAVSREALSVILSDADVSGLEPDARLTAMWLWTLTGGVSGGDDAESGDDEQDEDDAPKKKSAKGGYVLE